MPDFSTWQAKKKVSEPGKDSSVSYYAGLISVFVHGQILRRAQNDRLFFVMLNLQLDISSLLQHLFVFAHTDSETSSE